MPKVTSKNFPKHLSFTLFYLVSAVLVILEFWFLKNSGEGEGGNDKVESFKPFVLVFLIEMEPIFL